MIAIDACGAFGVVIETTSTAGSLMSARQIGVDLAQGGPAHIGRIAEHRARTRPRQGMTFAHIVPI